MSGTKSRLCLFVAASLIAFLHLPAQAADEIQTLSNRMAIAEALTQYPYRWDSKSTQSFADLFTEDAVMERWRKGALIEGSRLQGKTAIFEYAEDAHTGRLADRQTRHHFSNLVFLELSDRNAVTENMALITHQTADDAVARVSSSGIYRISWEKSAGEWKIAKRILFVDSFPTK
ncbi:MAG: hypothetical protein COB20_04565 [SAR86 cluster bacterium]|uniref:SnoaL-like domain-containing protein n=1 Tax=SAR86 cluster bacterium TaxID=2030880 RepID=A0A2A4XB78_9GAMM|nr:MAG: hypothetical protein COB20_04565 [SAR86 cluster bacterium]